MFRRKGTAGVGSEVGFEVQGGLLVGEGTVPRQLPRTITLSRGCGALVVTSETDFHVDGGKTRVDLVGVRDASEYVDVVHV